MLLWGSSTAVFLTACSLCIAVVMADPAEPRPMEGTYDLLPDRVKEDFSTPPNDDFAHRLYFVIVCIMDFLLSVTALSVLASFIKARCQSSKCCTKKGQDGLLESNSNNAVSVVVPCYLPNEKDIIMDTIYSIVDELQYTGELILHVVYNTPKTLPIEQELHAMEGKRQGKLSRLVHITKVEGSRSKAENLNKVLMKVDSPHVMIFDADHHPDPDCLELALHQLITRRCDCVQGSTYIRNLDSVLARIVNAEFFVTYFLFFPGMQWLARTGLFGGSNALWKTSALKRHDFNQEVQTEDIDLSTRAILDSYKIRYCPEARSGELAPGSLSALYKQRMRWCMGWDQVTIAHFKGISRSKISWGKKLGLYYILPARWFVILFSIVGAVINPVLGFVWWNKEWGTWTEAALTYSIGIYFFIGVVAMLQCSLNETKRGRYYFISRALWILIFFNLTSVYLCVQLSMICRSLFKITTGKVSGWEVTARKDKSAPKRQRAQHRVSHGSEFEDLDLHEDLGEGINLEDVEEEVSSIPLDQAVKLVQRELQLDEVLGNRVIKLPPESVSLSALLQRICEEVKAQEEVRGAKNVSVAFGAEAQRFQMIGAIPGIGSRYATPDSPEHSHLESWPAKGKSRSHSMSVSPPNGATGKQHKYGRGHTTETEMEAPLSPQGKMAMSAPVTSGFLSDDLEF